MFDRVERVLYRSLDVTVTTRRIALRGGEEYRVRDVVAIVPVVWSETRSGPKQML